MGWKFYNSTGQLLTAPASTASADLATVATTVTVTDNESTNENNVLTFVANADSDGGNVGLESDGNLYYNPSTGTLAATILSGTVATATVGTTVTVTDNESTNENNLITFVADAGDSTGAHGLEMDGTLNYNPSTGLVTATGFAGTLTGNVTGNATGNAATVTTNANLTGPVTSSGNATAIADKALAIAKLADGTDGELITWNASGVIAAVGVGTDGQVLTSGGAGVAPVFEDPAGGVTLSGSTDNTIATVTGSNALAGEANLTYSTDLSITSGNIVIATAGKGIDFAASTNADSVTGVTMDHEILDDYEEGTWTPTLGDNGGPDDATYDGGGQTGFYTKIGNVVIIYGLVSVDSNGSLATSEGAYIHGFPFTSQNIANSEERFFCGLQAAAVTAGNAAGGNLDQNTERLRLRVMGDTSGEHTMTITELNQGTVRFSGTYHVTA